MRRYLDDDDRILCEPVAGCRAFNIGEVRGIDKKNRCVTAVLSSETIDRYGEMIDQDCWEMEAFRRNPICLANHMHTGSGGEPPSVGRWISIGVENIKGVGKALVGTVQFMEDDDLAERWWQRFVQGVVTSFSVGFISHATEMRNFQDGNGQTRRVLCHKRCELLEVSCVSCPANPDAVILAASARGRQALNLGPDDDLAELLAEVRGDDGDASGDGLSNRQLNKKIARAVGPMVKRMLQEGLSEAGLIRGDQQTATPPPQPAPEPRKGSPEQPRLWAFLESKGLDMGDWIARGGSYIVMDKDADLEAVWAYMTDDDGEIISMPPGCRSTWDVPELWQDSDNLDELGIFDDEAAADDLDEMFAA